MVAVKFENGDDALWIVACLSARRKDNLPSVGRPVRISLRSSFSWEKQPRLGDEVFEGPENTKIFVDKKSLLYLNGTVLDYDTNLISKGFVFNNPNAKTTCGCGSSFGT